MRKLFVGDQVYLDGHVAPMSVIGIENGDVIISSGDQRRKVPSRDLRLPVPIAKQNQKAELPLTANMVAAMLPYFANHPKDVYAFDLHPDHVEQMKEASASAGTISDAVAQIKPGTNVQILDGIYKGHKGPVVAFDPRDQTYGVEHPNYVGWYKLHSLKVG